MKTVSRCLAALSAIFLVVPTASACSSTSSSDATSTTTPAVAPNTVTTATEVLPSTTVATTQNAVPPAATTTAAAEPATMPNVVCMNLQAAQNAIQRAGVFFSRSEDATGEGRRQIVDSNWIVVSQTPPAGSPVTEGQAVLSAVKIGEPNPC
ncbi:PASTA domain-containing protein [Gordonia polyisoprenivorans]|uniref:PASTA domain-containing protein n=1 Tax=Gordonia polyisoprenivorans TaxID=84595 RepID=UPI0030CB8C68